MKITELMHLLGEKLEEHGNVEVVMEHTSDIGPGCDCHAAQGEPEDDWWVVGISRAAIVTPLENSPVLDRGVKVKSVLLIGE